MAAFFLSSGDKSHPLHHLKGDLRCPSGRASEIHLPQLLAPEIAVEWLCVDDTTCQSVSSTVTPFRHSSERGKCGWCFLQKQFQRGRLLFIICFYRPEDVTGFLLLTAPLVHKFQYQFCSFWRQDLFAGIFAAIVYCKQEFVVVISCGYHSAVNCCAVHSKF